MKKFILMIIAMFSVIFVVGCNDTNSTTLRIVSFRVEDNSFYQWMHQKFEEENPGVKIDYDTIDTANYTTLLASRIQSEKLDVFFNEPHYVFDGAYPGNMLPLDDLSINEFIRDDILTAGKLYFPDEDVSKQLVIPLNITGQIVFYNKAIFAENNISVPKNWGEFISVLDKLKTASDVEAPIIYGGREQWPVNMILNAVEAQIVRADNPNFYTDIRDWDNHPEARFNNDSWIEVFTKTDQIFDYVQPNATGLSYASAPSLFVTGSPQTSKKYPILIDGSWSLGQILAVDPEFEVGAFILPSNDITEKNNVLPFKSGAGMSVFSRSKNVDLAKKYIEFHLREDIYTKYLEMTLFGSVLENVEHQNELIQEVFSDAYTPLATAENAKVPGMPWDVAAGVTNMILGQITPTDLATRINNDIEKNREIWEQNIDLINEK